MASYRKLYELRTVRLTVKGRDNNLYRLTADLDVTSDWEKQKNSVWRLTVAVNGSRAGRNSKAFTTPESPPVKWAKEYCLRKAAERLDCKVREITVLDNFDWRGV